MITKERLEQLIKEKAIIYEAKYNNINSVDLTRTIRAINYRYGMIEFEPSPKEKYLHHKYLKNLFESKEEAEFILKYHTSKTLKFEPPTWKEFLATREEGIWCHWFSGDIGVVMEEENHKEGILRTSNVFRVDDGNLYTSFRYEYDDFVDTREETYYEALDYAKKLFLEGNM